MPTKKTTVVTSRTIKARLSDTAMLGKLEKLKADKGLPEHRAMAQAVINMMNFDEAKIVARLSRVSPTSKAMFSLCCAARQKSAWQEFAKRFSPEAQDAVSIAIEKIWQSLGSNVVPINWSSLLDDIMDLLPEEQDEWAPLHVYADHALSSLAYTIRCLIDSSDQEAAWGARRAYEAADQAAIRQLDAQLGIAESEARILMHPIVQRELWRQERDLQVLERLSARDALTELKVGALHEQTLTLDEMMK